jgi:protein TonB
LTDDKIGNLVDFVRVKQDQQLETKQRKPKKPPPPDEPPPDVPPQNFNVAVDSAGFNMSNVDLSVSVDVGGGGFGISDGEYLPIVKVQPQYPRRALSRGLAGYVIVEFTVTAQGTVKNPFVVENCGHIPSARSPAECLDKPNSVFDSAALKAAAKFKYKPKVIDGNPVETGGVQNKIVFELAES